MKDVDILAEIRAFREKFAADHNYDIAAMGATLREIAAAKGWKLVRRPPRPAVIIPVPPRCRPEPTVPADH